MRRFRVWRHRRKMNPAAEIRRLSDEINYIHQTLDDVCSELFEHNLELHELGRVDVNDILQRVQELESRATAEANYNESFERI